MVNLCEFFFEQYGGKVVWKIGWTVLGGGGGGIWKFCVQWDNLWKNQGGIMVNRAPGEVPDST